MALFLRTSGSGSANSFNYWLLDGPAWNDRGQVSTPRALSIALLETL